MDVPRSPGDNALIDAVGEYLTSSVGKVSTVYHELHSPDIHVDVYHVRPKIFRRHHILMTSGMAEKGMLLPDGLSLEWRHAELMMNVWPGWAGWRGGSDASFWPIGMLKVLARFPHQVDTWLGPGHTLQFQPEHTVQGFSGAILVPPTSARFQPRFSVPDGRKVNVYMLVPLYAEEIDYKLRKGSDALLGAVASSGTPIEEFVMVRPSRKCYV